MFKSLIYKEWLKTGMLAGGLLLLLLCFTGYDFIALAKNAEIRGYSFLWSFAVLKNSILVDNLKLLPVVCGVLLAVAQFVPESARKRLKLTLHLPYPQGKTICVMQGYGLAILLVLFVLQAIALGIFLGRYLPAEVTGRILFSFLTWYCAGAAAYIWAGAICLEPSWRLRITEAVTAAIVMSIFYSSASAMAYRHSILLLFVTATLLATLLIHYSVRRFKDGVQ